MSDETCPNCGYCKHCGRANPPAREPWRFIPTPQIVPWIPGPTTVPQPAQPAVVPTWIPLGPEWIDGINIACGDVTVRPSVDNEPVTKLTTGIAVFDPTTIKINNASSSVH